MGRLTTEYCGAYVPREMCSIDRAGGVDDCDMCCEYCEATEEGHDGCDDCAIYKCFNKLGEYEDLEERGHLLRLPCAVGDTVYRVHKGTKLSPDRTYECRVVGVKQEYNTFSVKLYANINEETYSIWIDDWFDRCQIGYEFFLTREEAEAALKGLERGKGE